MQIDNIRVQNFRCIRDSGEVPLTPDLTIFIGENESGKTALLDALFCFNLENEFSTRDLSTMSPIRESVLSEVIGRDTIDMVTIAVKIPREDSEQLSIPASVLASDTLRVTKRFDNSYVIKGANGTPLSELYASIKSNRLLVAIKGIRPTAGVCIPRLHSSKVSDGSVRIPSPVRKRRSGWRPDPVSQ